MEPAASVQMWDRTAGARGPALHVRRASTAASSTENWFGWNTRPGTWRRKWDSDEVKRGMSNQKKKERKRLEASKSRREFSVGLLIKWPIYVSSVAWTWRTTELCLMVETVPNQNNFLIVSCSEKTCLFDSTETTNDSFFLGWMQGCLPFILWLCAADLCTVKMILQASTVKSIRNTTGDFGLYLLISLRNFDPKPF